MNKVKTPSRDNRENPEPPPCVQHILRVVVVVLAFYTADTGGRIVYGVAPVNTRVPNNARSPRN